MSYKTSVQTEQIYVGFYTSLETAAMFGSREASLRLLQGGVFIIVRIVNCSLTVAIRLQYAFLLTVGQVEDTVDSRYLDLAYLE